MDLIDPALPELQDLVWDWSAAQDPTSNLYAVLATWGILADELAAAAGQIADDANMTTAGRIALRNEYAVLWGVANENLPTDPEVLRAYLLARSEEDGSIGSLLTTLLTLLRVPVNLSGIVIAFPSVGGLKFDPGGLGIGPLFEATAIPTAVLTWPLDGSALIFPADGSGLILGTGDNGFVRIVQKVSAPTYTVFVKSWLAFDRGQFARAVERFRPAHALEPTIVEENT